ncbi:MAG: hypothetical protein ACLR78_05760 [Roseburia sp.]
MKKHVLLAAALCVTAVMATACGSKNTVRDNSGRGFRLSGDIRRG